MTLDVLRIAAHTLPGSTVQVAGDAKPLPDGGQVFTINELGRRGEVVAEARLHVVADPHGIYPVREGSALHDLITKGRPLVHSNN